MLKQVELESLKCCKQTEFWFTFQQLTCSDALKISQILPTNSTVTNLNLNGNKIGCDGAIALAGVLSKIPTLAHLNLSGNEIGDLGAQALAKSLIGNRTIRSLCLLGNLITDAGALDLAKMLASNSYIQKLYLYHNKISDQGAIAIAEAAGRHMQLESLWIDHNLVSFEGSREIVRLITRSRSLTDFELTIKNELLPKHDREDIQIMCKGNMQRSTLKTDASRLILDLSRKLMLLKNLPIELQQFALMVAVDDKVFGPVEQLLLGKCLLDRSLIGKLTPFVSKAGSLEDLTVISKLPRYSGQELVRSCATLVEQHL